MPKTHKTSALTIKSNVFEQKNAWSTQFWWKPKINVLDLQIEKHRCLYCDRVSVRLISGGRVTYTIFQGSNTCCSLATRRWTQNCLIQGSMLSKLDGPVVCPPDWPVGCVCVCVCVCSAGLLQRLTLPAPAIGAFLPCAAGQRRTAGSAEAPGSPGEAVQPDHRRGQLLVPRGRGFLPQQPQVSAAGTSGVAGTCG